MPDEDEAAGAWSRPDAGVDPADYVEGEAAPSDHERSPNAAADTERQGSRAGSDRSDEPTASDAGSEATAERTADPMAPGDSLISNGDEDAVEPNEPG
jgi:hypothetical protein